MTSTPRPRPREVLAQQIELRERQHITREATQGLRWSREIIAELDEMRPPRLGRGAALGVVLSLLQCSDDSGGQVYPSTRYLAERCGARRQAISALLVAMRSRGWLTDTGERRGRGVIVYRLTRPRAAQTSDRSDTSGIPEGPSSGVLQGPSNGAVVSRGPIVVGSYRAHGSPHGSRAENSAADPGGDSAASDEQAGGQR